MPNVWFIADTHFGHRSMVRGSALELRPEFWDTQEMDEHLVQRWNSMVQPKDDVYHLGDFAFAGTARTVELLGRLHGRKYLIEGNHDEGMSQVARSLFEWVKPLHYLRLASQVRITLCHYPLLSWRNMHHGALHFHGHSHGNLQTKVKGRLDVGVDNLKRYFNSYIPVALDAAIALANQGEAYYPDHHAPTEEPT